MWTKHTHKAIQEHGVGGSPVSQEPADEDTREHMERWRLGDSRRARQDQLDAAPPSGRGPETSTTTTAPCRTAGRLAGREPPGGSWPRSLTPRVRTSSRRSRASTWYTTTASTGRGSRWDPRPSALSGWTDQPNIRFSLWNIFPICSWTDDNGIVETDFTGKNRTDVIEQLFFFTPANNVRYLLFQTPEVW